RVLPVFGLRSALPAERDLFVVPDGKRAAVFDESLRLLRIALREDDVTFSGDYFTVRNAQVLPKPTPPLDIWIGGATAAAFRRIGTLGDGWLGSFLTPSEAAQARQAIMAAADAAGRQIEPDHYGINLAVGNGDLPAPVLAAIRKRRPDLDPAELVAADWPTLHRRLDDYISAGLTKFVIRPAGDVDTSDFLDAFVTQLLPLQN
ncbi:MAG TPA: TIGR03854 family LLM class F420-dependent oxidoreductase, partial [Mycobacterium sp.]|nr:TIGR03854 family LLM class F420-dependent oxidoreductase [Mycobacterium sp.]